MIKPFLDRDQRERNMKNDNLDAPQSELLLIFHYLKLFFGSSGSFFLFDVESVLARKKRNIFDLISSFGGSRLIRIRMVLCARLNETYAVINVGVSRTNQTFQTISQRVKVTQMSSDWSLLCRSKNFLQSKEEIKSLASQDEFLTHFQLKRIYESVK